MAAAGHHYGYGAMSHGPWQQIKCSLVYVSFAGNYKMHVFGMKTRKVCGHMKHG